MKEGEMRPGIKKRGDIQKLRKQGAHTEENNSSHKRHGLYTRYIKEGKKKDKYLLLQGVLL